MQITTENIIQGPDVNLQPKNGRREEGTNNSSRAKSKILLMLNNIVQVIFHEEIDHILSSLHIVGKPCFLFKNNLSLKGKTHLFP